MLTHAERQDVRRYIVGVLAGSVNFRTTLCAIFDVDAEPLLTRIPPGVTNHQEVAELTVKYCLESRWTHEPSLLERLLDDLVIRGHALLVPLRERVKVRVDPTPDPLASGWISADRPFFGRARTRAVVKKLLESSDAPILLVQGEPASGKSYTCDWLDYLSDDTRCGFRIVIERLERKAGPTMEPDVLAESLVSQMGRPINHPPYDPAKSRYEQRLCNWLTGEALQAEGCTWVVLDGFDDPDLHPGTKALIQHLAFYVQSGTLSRRLRLVLIDFRSSLTRVDAYRIQKDDLRDPTVDSSELESCLLQHFHETGQAVEDAFVAELAKTLVDKARMRSQPPELSKDPELKRLHDAVYRLRQADLTRVGRGAL